MDRLRLVVLAMLCAPAAAQEEAGEPAPVQKSPWAWMQEGDDALVRGDRDAAIAAYRAAAEAGGEEHGILRRGADPTPALGHDAKTPPETRARIDALVRRLLDPFTEEADAEVAVRDLAGIGTPALHPLLAALARERDRMQGTPSLEEGLRLTSLARGDACLREIDPFLDAMGKDRIGPRSTREYVAFVLGVHYARSGTVRGLVVPGVSDPPTDLAHLDDTPVELRRAIDDLVAVMLDPMAGRASLEALEKLKAVGKPAFPRILGAMARLVYTLPDENGTEERLVESSLLLADRCLRAMDGYCDARGYALIRPGVELAHARLVLKLHYKRWRTYLHAVDEMPGPYDPGEEAK